MKSSWLTQRSRTALSHSICALTAFLALLLTATSLSLYFSVSPSVSPLLSSWQLQRPSQLSAPLWQRQLSGGRPSWLPQSEWSGFFFDETQQCRAKNSKWHSRDVNQKTHPCAKSYTERSARGVAAVWKCMSNKESIDVWSAEASPSRQKE